VDERTLRYYEAHAPELMGVYESVREGVQRFFPLAFLRGSRILDIGAGSGRDLAALVREGHAAYGVEPTAAFREIAVRQHPELMGRLFEGALPSLPSLGKFDGVLCTAVLQHVPRAHLFDAVYSLKELLNLGGRVLLTIPAARPGLDADERDDRGRLFTRLVQGEVELLFERVGFGRIGCWQEADPLGRAGHAWVVLLFQLRHAGTNRPLDLVESVLSRRERKVATYKLALFRALVDIALTQSRTARWRDDGQVAVPIREIAERWIDYYWPLFRSRTFLPQMNGEQGAAEHKLAFAKPLEKLIECYKAGDLRRFASDRRDEALSPVAAGIHRTLLAKLGRTIREGPVTHAGSASGTGRLFRSEGDEVLLAGSLWQELSLTGHWIRDALILRWGEKVAELSGDAITPAHAVSALLKGPDAERDAEEARKVYDRLEPLECAWTGRPLRRREYEIDHVLPFSIWRNNDLWNLLPAAPKVNREKRDRLPTRDLLGRRRPAILRCWDACQSERPARFLREAAAQVGTSSPTLPELFNALIESVEVTALQRGVERWSI
jgi:SAM-dependent methyltransferase